MNKKKGSSFLQKLAIGAVGVVAGIAAYHIFSQANKSQIKSQSKVQQQQNTKSPYETDIDNYDQLQQLMTCPISHELMLQPALITQCGHTFEKKYIVQWVNRNGNCPLCKVQTSQDHLKVNYHLKKIIAQYQIKKQQESKAKKQFMMKN